MSDALAQAEGTGSLTLDRTSGGDLHMEITARLAQLVALSEPGSRLPTERKLSEMLGVGRSTVREAIRSLAFIGAIQARQGSGTYVSDAENGAVDRLIGLGLIVQRSKVHEVIEARRVLEVEAVRLAAVHHTRQDCLALEANMRHLEASASNPEKATKCDLEFHVLLARASHNSVLVHFINGMGTLFEIWIKKTVTHRRIIEATIKEHYDVLEGVCAGDPERAASAMTLHLSNASERLYSDIGREQSMADYVSAIIAHNE